MSEAKGGKRKCDTMEAASDDIATSLRKIKLVKEDVKQQSLDVDLSMLSAAHPTPYILSSWFGTWPKELEDVTKKKIADIRLSPRASSLVAQILRIVGRFYITSFPSSLQKKLPTLWNFERVVEFCSYVAENAENLVISTDSSSSVMDDLLCGLWQELSNELEYSTI